MFNNYPYTDTHELNLDWIIRKMKELNIQFDEFKVINTITFSGAWDITKNYPAWTIVSDNNIGYVSIQPVPAGVLLTNGDYWREVIDYTAQIAGLQTRVIALENTVGDASSGLVHDVDELQTDVTDIKNHVYKKYLFVSDSYGASVVPELVTMMNLSASDYVSIQQGGSCFGIAETNPLNWLYMIQNATISDKETFTDVVYIGGANEYSYPKSDVSAHAADCYDYVASEFINAKQWYMFCAFFAGISGDTYDQVNRVRLFRSGLTGVASCGRAFAVKECWYPLADADNLNSSDWVHPTATGAKYLAMCISSCLNGGEAYYSTGPLETFTLTTTNTINTWQADMYRCNEMCKMIIRAANITLATPVNLSGYNGATIVLGTISNRLLRGGDYSSNGNCELLLGSFATQAVLSDSTTIEVAATLSLTLANELKLHIMPTWNTLPVTINQVIFYYFDATVNDRLH